MTRTHKGLGGRVAAVMTAKPKPEDQTHTLRGIGHVRQTLRGLGEKERINREHMVNDVEIACPACAVKADQVSPDLAACAALALMCVKGADAIRPLLCTMHARLFRLLLVEVEQGPKKLAAGGSSSWED